LQRAAEFQIRFGTLSRRRRLSWVSRLAFFPLVGMFCNVRRNFKSGLGRDVAILGPGIGLGHTPGFSRRQAFLHQCLRRSSSPTVKCESRVGCMISFWKTGIRNHRSAERLLSYIVTSPTLSPV
jgi:hypothetical protein